MEYCLAAALLHGQMGLAQFTDRSAQDAHAQDLLQKVRLVHPDQEHPDWDTMRPDVVEVVLRNGRRL